MFFVAVNGLNTTTNILTSNALSTLNTLSTINTAQLQNSTTGAPKKKKKKKSEKEKKPRPKPGEIRLTTALDGSTLYCCPECHMAYPEKVYHPIKSLLPARLDSFFVVATGTVGAASSGPHVGAKVRLRHLRRGTEEKGPLDASQTVAQSGTALRVHGVPEGV